MHIPLRIRSVLRKLKDALSVIPTHTESFFHARVLAPMPYHFSEHDAQIVAEIIRSGKLHHDQGQEMVSFEHEFAGFVGTDHAIATNSGTSALMLAVKALGLDPGDEVIVPAYTFVATAQSVLSNNAIPIFADIDSTFTISPKSIERNISKRTKAIIVVHMFGNVADMDRIMHMAKKYRLCIIEDCAQAVGAFYKGKSVGSFGDIGCFSFNIKKALPTGQGGMVVTNNQKYHRIAKVTRNTGLEYIHGAIDAVSLGGTYFMTEMEAALGRSVLKQLPRLNRSRQKNFEHLIKLMEPLKKLLSVYRILPNSDPSYSRIAFLLNTESSKISRDQFIQAAQAEGVPLKKFYPTPLYRYSLFHGKKDLLTGQIFPFSENKRSFYKKLPFAERFNKQHVGMEFSPYWDTDDMKYIADTFINILY